MADTAIVDLRSDTVTLPSAPMRRAMSEAEVGDDVYGEDPTARRLEELAAEMLGREAAIFVPTGTMGNQIAVHLLARRGTEVLLEEGSHVYNYELGAMAAWTGALPRVLRGERGFFEPDVLERALWPQTYYYSRASLVVLENSHNHAGGTVLRPDLQGRLLECARRHDLKVHLDGARIFNAAAALERPARSLAAGFDTVMFCLSKGLGAPVGSLLCGDRDLIDEARVVRKRMGGGMRQVGVLAAAGVVALEENVDRLGEDHRRARTLAQAIEDLSFLRVRPETVETNMVMGEVIPPITAEEVLDALRRRGVLAGTMGPGRIRFVTHLDIDDSGIERAIGALRAVA